MARRAARPQPSKEQRLSLQQAVEEDITDRGHQGFAGGGAGGEAHP